MVSHLGGDAVGGGGGDVLLVFSRRGCVASLPERVRGKAMARQVLQLSRRGRGTSASEAELK